MIHIPGILILAALCAGTLAAQPECATCHPEAAASHGASNHARAARPVQESQFFRNLPSSRPIGEARGGFLLYYTPEGSSVRVTAERGMDRAQGRIEWVLGSGDQGETPIVQVENGIVEHRISYYAKAGRFDLTLGHRPGASPSARAALGIVQKRETARACFGCHNSVGTEGEILRPGVGCERCHAGAGLHARGGAPPVNPARLGARDAVAVCAACHRLDPPGKPDDPLNIRFQPLRLVKSRCYTMGAITCSTCHEAHLNARRNDADYYAAKCIACHSRPHRSEGCVSCHMPRSSPVPYLTFTDHYIR